jgi:hypothetical protein
MVLKAKLVLFEDDDAKKFFASFINSFSVSATICILPLGKTASGCLQISLRRTAVFKGIVSPI